MKIIQNILFVFIFSFNTPNFMMGQNADLEAVKLEINEAALREQDAFKIGDCSVVLDLMESDITFLANGRKVSSKGIIEKFCNSVPRPFKKPLVDKLEIFPLSQSTGYVIRTLEYLNDEKTKMKEYVTKIWRKSNGEWKISHLHSTIQNVPVED